MYEMLGYCRKNQYDFLTDYLLQGIYNLEKAGADFAVLASNTPHVVFDTLEKKSAYTLTQHRGTYLSSNKRKEIQKCGMAGYRLYDGTALLQKRFIENGIHVTVPNNEERKLIDNVIAKELEFGIVNIDSKKTIDDIIQRLISEDNIEAIIMGCTELPLMYSNEKFPVPVFDTLKYHIQGIIEFMFKFR